MLSQFYIKTHSTNFAHFVANYEADISYNIYTNFIFTEPRGASFSIMPTIWEISISISYFEIFMGFSLIRYTFKSICVFSSPLVSNLALS